MPPKKKPLFEVKLPWVMFQVDSYGKSFDIKGYARQIRQKSRYSNWESFYFDASHLEESLEDAIEVATEQAAKYARQLGKQISPEDFLKVFQ